MEIKSGKLYSEICKIKDSRVITLDCFVRVKNNFIENLRNQYFVMILWII